MCCNMKILIQLSWQLRLGRYKQRPLVDEMLAINELYRLEEEEQQRIVTSNARQTLSVFTSNTACQRRGDPHRYVRHPNSLLRLPEWKSSKKEEELTKRRRVDDVRRWWVV